MGKREIIAEDLGYMSDTVRKLVRDYLYDYATPEEQLYKSMIALVLRSAGCHLHHSDAGLAGTGQFRPH